MKKGKLDFSLELGLRLFKLYKVKEGEIIVYGKMEEYEKAVMLALENSKEDLAKMYA
jgi:hypothetical protein